MRVEIKNDNVHTMTLFSDDALQFENLAACGIHRDASLRILQSACSDCESLYNILKRIDCNKGHDANELTDGNTNTKIEIKKEHIIHVESATYGNGGNPLIGIVEKREMYDEFFKSLTNGKDRLDYIFTGEPSERGGLFDRKFLEVKFRCGSGPLETLTAWDESDGAHVSIDCTQPKIQVQEATYKITSPNSNVAIAAVNSSYAGNRTSWLKKEADGKSQVSTFLFPNTKEGSERDPPGNITADRMLEIKYKCGDSGPVETMTVPGVPGGAIHVQFSCIKTAPSSK